MIISITSSPRKTKRFRVTMDDGRVFDFGYDKGTTYIDHGDENKRLAYWKRHYANPTEKRLIDNLVPSPALFSAYLLWGRHPLDGVQETRSTSLEKNIRLLNEAWWQKAVAPTTSYEN